MGKEVDDFLESCKILWKDFNNCKAHFPYVPIEAKGAKTVRTAPFYIAQGFDISFLFSEGISEDGIRRINQIGHWLNQNYVIRLCAVLEYFGIISNSIRIDFKLDGAEHVNIARRLRNCFAHSSGRYNPENEDHRETMKLMHDNLGVSIDGHTDWPLLIDKVLKPLHDACIKYALQKMECV
jgi:hypothetical protein